MALGRPGHQGDPQARRATNGLLGLEIAGAFLLPLTLGGKRCVPEESNTLTRSNSGPGWGRTTGGL